MDTDKHGFNSVDQRRVANCHPPLQREGTSCPPPLQAGNESERGCGRRPRRSACARTAALELFWPVSAGHTLRLVLCTQPRSGNPRRELEKKSGRKVVTSENYLALAQSVKKVKRVK